MPGGFSRVRARGARIFRDGENLSFVNQELSRKVVRGAFRLKRLGGDPQAQKRIILAAFSEIFVKDLSIVAFKFREDFGLSARNEFGDGFAAPPIHLETPFTMPSIDPLPDGMRRCSCCRGVFPATEFYPRKGQCRGCIAVKAHQAYTRRKEAQ
jgi:hypothetical protein